MKRFLLFIIFLFLIIGCHKRLPIKDYTLNDPRLTKRYPKYFTATTFNRYRHNAYKKVSERKTNFFARFSVPGNYDDLKDFYALDRGSRGKIRTDFGEMNAEIPLEEEQTEPTMGAEPNSETKDKNINKSDKKLQEVDKQKKELNPSATKETEKIQQSKKEEKTKPDKELAKVEETKELKKREVKNTIDFEVPEEYIKLTELGLPNYYRTFLSDKNERVVEVLYIEKDLMFQFINRRLAYVGEVSDLELILLEKGYPQSVFIRNTKEGTNVITLIYTSRFGTMQKIYSICDGVREHYQEVP
jgi:hypothetical protein